ncbi:PrsW family glutamic-type intramembrane protease [Propionimicrobium sp. PCR01-08-3]|uniref:PrsW family intramembrane metalloprotease n=1 Tax=Propionimicrobium sp. PCR01-08-3 TaxID=3052086 RepID=UPI00255CF59F|nr:PrsW family glutamic-type intramembrane protease [Propionimicrobium sp. PCR01-08-3]WIY83572.1 PrsW family glutamic-type intramembrane protease [Propionimicrobium sp. PCR01-08-3]
MTEPTIPAPRQKKFLPLSVLLGGVGAYIAILIVLVVTQNSNLFPALLLVGSLTVPLAVLLWAARGPHGDLAPGGIIVATVLAGGVTGILLAGVFESIAAAAVGEGVILFVGIIEETAKLIVPLVVLRIAYPRTTHGGVVIGVAAGAGFAVLETMGYGFNALLEKGAGLGAVDATLLVRGIFAPAGHIAWTGILCAAIWYWRSGRRNGLGAFATFGTWIAVIVLHTVWDAAASIPVHVIVGTLSLGALIWVVNSTHHSHPGAEPPRGPMPPWQAQQPYAPHPVPPMAPQMRPYGQGDPNAWPHPVDPNQAPGSGRPGPVNP